MSLFKTESSRVGEVVSRIQASVRGERPYVVGGDPNLPIKLNQNENPYDLPPALKQELLEAFRAIPFNRYPKEHPDALRDALAESVGRDPACVLVGNGSNDLSYLVGLCLLRKGTPVVMPRPMFSLYEKVVRLYEADLTAVGPRPDLSFDAEGLASAVSRVNPALTVICTPNNPTGLAMTYDQIEQVAAAASGLVLVDEAYVDFNGEREALPLVDQYPSVVVMRTFSKAWGLAGLRLGYLIGHPQVIQQFARARVPFSVDALAEATALTLLKHADLVRERAEQIRRERDLLVAALQEIDQVEVVPSEANFAIFRTPLEPATLISRLATSGVLIRDVGGYPELRGFVRVNAGSPGENHAFLAALKSALFS